MVLSPVMLITGANTGLGLETVKAMYKSDRPSTILVCGRSIQKAQDAVASLLVEVPDSKSKLVAMQCDISDDGSIQAAFEKVESDFGHLDVLINNAGAGFDHEFYSGNMTMRQAWNASWDVNVSGTQWMTYTFAPLLIKSPDPRLLFVTSGTSSLVETFDPDFSNGLNCPPPAGWPKTEAGNLRLVAVGVEKLKHMGALDPSVGGNFIKDVVEGKRDAHTGLVIRRSGPQPCVHSVDFISAFATMALREMRRQATGLVAYDSRPAFALCNKRAASLRNFSSPQILAQNANELEDSSSFEAEPISESWDPLEFSKARTDPLPPSRYQFRPPKYYRGPLHPHQPPRPSDPASREFIPGPFTAPRLAQTYTSTFAPDLMTLAYQHYPPGYTAPTKGERLRSWDESSPYHKGRPLRGPRGGDPLRMLRKPITFRNIPRLEAITVHSFVSKATEDSSSLHVAGMALQAITGVRAQAHAAKHNVVQWGIRAGKHLSVTCEIKGEDAYHFLAKTVDVVLPRIKDWKGVKGSSGDSSGNIAFGLTPDVLALYPEIEVNYDSYPAKLIPGCHIIIKTSARTDREARLLLTTLGLPFYGKFVN
ncbi:hypothetical protein FH972_023594 [Carpinus fangiana]|uniref:Large ribosomal subunit protein uL5c n=1 Tax=Carpinus fangiana TaxID=176857 RepID=A0A5N6KXW4_9ROSI|nr:hypothetical protein FH972_023594 [Carpinus fangiana]